MQITRIKYLFSGLSIITIYATLNGCKSISYTKELSDKLKTDIEILKEDPSVIEGKLIYNSDIITQLYEKGGNLLSIKWGSRDKIAQMLSAIRNVSNDGLKPDDYHLSAIEKLADKIILSDVADVKDIAQLELLLTDSFLLLSAHLAAGKTDAETIDPQWKASRRKVRLDWERFTDSTLASNNIIKNLETLTPKHREYTNLKMALLKYRKIEENGGWGSFNSNLSKLEIGMRNHDVALLRKRLAITQGYIDFNIEDENLFDHILRNQVISFQFRNGLTADGIVGKVYY